MTREEAARILKDFVLYAENVRTIQYRGSVTLPVEALNMAIKVLERKPKRGKWIDREQCQVDEDAYEVAICSNCKADITLEYPYDNFCPNCGARMESDEE